MVLVEESRWDTRLGPADGIVSPETLALLPGARITVAGGSISATRIEAYVQCPYRYFQRHILGLVEPDDPEAVFEISALDRGTIVHRVLERTYRALKDARLLPLGSAAWGPAEAFLEQAMADEFRRAEREMALGPAPLWEITREAIASAIREFLRAEAASGDGFTPLDFEVEFGAGEPAGPVRVEIDGGSPGGSIVLGGKIDRIDLAAGGRSFRVVDYKTGKRLPGEPFDGGRSLQLPIYLLAAKSILEARGIEVDLESSRAAYLSLEGKSREFAGSGAAGWTGQLRLALQTVARGIESGTFHAIPGPRRDNCTHCDFKDHCDPRVEAIAARKDDPRMRPLDAMRTALENR
jgi:ATP-dependent helicase/DNAse subunit B